MKHIRTVEDVVEGLGGAKAVADWTDCWDTNVYGWLKKEVIPPRYFNEFEKRLGPLPRHLFGWWRP